MYKCTFSVEFARHLTKHRIYGFTNTSVVVVSVLSVYSLVFDVWKLDILFSVALYSQGQSGQLQAVMCRTSKCMVCQFCVLFCIYVMFYCDSLFSLHYLGTASSWCPYLKKCRDYYRSICFLNDIPTLFSALNINSLTFAFWITVNLWIPIICLVSRRVLRTCQRVATNFYWSPWKQSTVLNFKNA